MAQTTFDEFVRRVQAEAQSNDSEPVDWESEKLIWLSRLDELYRSAEGFLRPYIEAGQISVSFEEEALEEQGIGFYKVKRMLINIGRRQIALEPIGMTMLIGSAGRVDVVGVMGRVPLLLLRESVLSLPDPDNGSLQKNEHGVRWVWRIKARPPVRSVIELNEANFLNLLAEVSNA